MQIVVQDGETVNVNLVRTQRGRVIHRADCPWVRRPVTGQGVPWHWADDQTEDVIVATIAGYGYRTCRHCKPIDENKLAAWAFLGYLKAIER